MTDAPVPADSEQKRLILELYKEIGVNERHFNELETKYRFLASTWSLAMLGGLGFLASLHDANFLFVDKKLVASIVGGLGALGNTLVWNLDLRVYHQLLDAQFVEGLELERENDWFPRSRIKMFSGFVGGIEEHTSVRVLPNIRFFYFIPIALGLIICVTFGTASALSIKGLTKEMFVAVGMLCGLGGGLIALLWGGAIYIYSRSVPVQDWVTKRKAERKGLDRHALNSRY
jgi:hypothetical protein